MLGDYYCLWVEIAQKTERAVLLFSPEPSPEEIWVPLRLLHPSSLLRKDLEEGSYVTGTPYLALIGPEPLFRSRLLIERARRFRDLTLFEQELAFPLPREEEGRPPSVDYPGLIAALKSQQEPRVEVAAVRDEEEYYSPVATIQQEAGLGLMPVRREAGGRRKPSLLTTARRKVEL